MGKISRILAVAVASLALLAVEAQAARVGGGKSAGRQSSNVTQREAMPQQATPGMPAQQAQQAAPKPAPAAQPQASGARRWLGPLAGLAAGLGLAALASHFGFGEEMASMMMILLLAFAAFFVFRLIMARRAQARGGMEPAYSGAGIGSEAGVRYAPLPDAPATGSTAAPVGSAAAPAMSTATWRIPQDFDVAGFVQNAKQQFVRLQAANDTGNLADLREFTTPELFAELSQQVQQRGAQANRTDVVRLDADLLGIETDATSHLASVRFHGLIRETEGGAAEPFDEVWNLEKPVNGQSGWMLAGIQQLN